MLIKENVLIPYLKKERTLHIYIPEPALEGERFPVFYMFDGHNLFLDEDATYGKSWGMLKYFTENHVRCIVVGIECNHKSNFRLREFSPYSFIVLVVGFADINLIVPSLTSNIFQGKLSLFIEVFIFDPEYVSKSDNNSFIFVLLVRSSDSI